ncbi:MAG: hypothetical protein AAFP08_02630, partial [Bacteroidota bacterium]
MHRQKVNRFLSIYLFLALLFMPFPWQSLSWWTQVVHALWDKPTALATQWITGIDSPLGLSSDSPQLVTLLFLLLVPAFMINLLLSKQRYSRLTWVSTLSFLLALIFLRYGLDKLSGGQFSAPDLFVLDSKVAELDNDILYWTVIGSSRSYQWFLGIAEIVPALMLLWHKTRPLGLILLLPVVVNIVAVNWCFDISVKVLSGLLLIVNGWCLFLYYRSIQGRLGTQHLRKEVNSKKN